jgi:hypothetical protein
MACSTDWSGGGSLRALGTGSSTKEDLMPTPEQRRSSAGNPDRLPIFSSVGQRRRNLSGIAILVLTGMALIVLAVVLVSAVQ